MKLRTNLVALVLVALVPIVEARRVLDTQRPFGWITIVLTSPAGRAAI